MRHRVLVVEDNQPNRELLCDWLEAQDFDVSSAANLQEAYAAFENHAPDAVLLDVQLGKEDGLSLASWIRQAPELQHTPVIAVTAHAMLTDQERVIQAGCNACVSKPVDFKVLRKHLQQWLMVASVLQKETPAEK